MQWKMSALDLARSFGYLHEEEVHILQYSVGEFSNKPATIVNIGAGFGTSTLAMREVCPDATIYSIDISEGSPEGGFENERGAFRKGGYDLDRYPIQILGDSKIVGRTWDKGKIDILFVDGDHSFAGILGDLNAWLPHVKPNGIIALHDYDSSNWPFVHQVSDWMLAQQVVLRHADTLKVYRRTRHVPFETVIPASPLDLNKLPYVIDSLTAFTDTLAINIITPEPERVPLPRDRRVPIKVHSDDNVLNIDRSRIRFRPNWVMQQFLKLFHDVTMTDYYLIIDADLLFNRPIEFFKDDKPIMMLGHDQYHDPYFEFNKKMIGVGQVYPHSFLSECTLYYKPLIWAMLRENGYESKQAFIDKAIEVIDGGCYPAESELYGNYIASAHPDFYLVQKLRAVLGGKYGGQEWTKEEIEQRIREIKAQDADIYTIHSWEGFA